MALGPGSAVLLGLIHLGAFVVVFALGASLAKSPQGIALNAVVGGVLGPLIALYVGLVRHTPQLPTREAVGLVRLEPGRGWLFIGLAVALGFVLAPLAAELTARVFQVFPMAPLDPETEQQLAEAERMPPATLVLVLLGLVVAAPFVEELLYRGLMQRQLVLPAGAETWRRVALPALLYAAAQVNPRFALAALGLAVALTVVVRAAGGSVWPAIAAHVAHRAAPFVLAGLFELELPDYIGASETGGYLPPVLTLGCAGIAAALLWIMWRLRLGPGRMDS